MGRGESRQSLTAKYDASPLNGGSHWPVEGGQPRFKSETMSSPTGAAASASLRPGLGERWSSMLPLRPGKRGAGQELERVQLRVSSIRPDRRKSFPPKEPHFLHSRSSILSPDRSYNPAEGIQPPKAKMFRVL